mmetsp:Transcript_54466/g.174650  ORF Transcript_54466/g.174650 Transcript_54466/m.174650 type:complete len:349 (+) Transcript_54466:114-1160(+)
MALRALLAAGVAGHLCGGQMNTPDGQDFNFYMGASWQPPGGTSTELHGTRLHFASFATEGFEEALDELCKEARESGIFVETHCFATLPEEAMNGRWSAMVRKPGVSEEWLWRPAFVQYILRHIPEGDAVLYSDASVELEKDPASWRDVLHLLHGSDVDIVAFQRSSNMEFEYTKADVFREFGIRLDDVEASSYQVTASYFLARNTRSAQLLLNDWASMMSDTAMLTDKPSHMPNHRNFISHQHEASIWSMLIKANRKGSSCTPRHKVANVQVKLLPYRGCDDLREVANSPIRAHCVRHRKGLKNKINKAKHSSLLQTKGSLLSSRQDKLELSEPARSLRLAARAAVLR